MVEGNPELMVGFVEDVVFCNPNAFNATLTVVVKAYNQDITDTIADSDVRWSRYSVDAMGNPRTTADAVWGRLHGNAGKVLSLTIDDIEYDPIAPPSLVRFTATVNK
jgi:hypothetical protein